MKNEYVAMNLTVPKKIKAFYERQAKRLMVSMTGVVRSVLAEHVERETAKSRQADESK